MSLWPAPDGEELPVSRAGAREAYETRSEGEGGPGGTDATMVTLSLSVHHALDVAELSVRWHSLACIALAEH